MKYKELVERLKPARIGEMAKSLDIEIDQYVGSFVSSSYSGHPEDFFYAIGVELARLFCVDHSEKDRLFRKKKYDTSKLLTKQQIAQILVDNGLVPNNKKGLEEADKLIKIELGQARWHEWTNIKGEKAYRLYIPQAFDGM